MEKAVHFRVGKETTLYMSIWTVNGIQDILTTYFIIVFTIYNLERISNHWNYFGRCPFKDDIVGVREIVQVSKAFALQVTHAGSIPGTLFGLLSLTKSDLGVTEPGIKNSEHALVCPPNQKHNDNPPKRPKTTFLFVSETASRYKAHGITCVSLILDKYLDFLKVSYCKFLSQHLVCFVLNLVKFGTIWLATSKMFTGRNVF